MSRSLRVRGAAGNTRPDATCGSYPDPLRIGVLAPPWIAVPPPAYGGTEGVIDRLARGLQAAGHEVRLWTTGDATCPVPRGSTFETAAGEPMGLTTTELEHTIAAYEWFTAERCDVVHDHTLAGPLVATGPAPVVTTNHNPFGPPGLAAIYRRISATTRIIAISRHHASVARRLGIPVAHVIHHGVDVDEFAVGDGTGDERGPYLAFVGRMDPTKGVGTAIDVARAAGWRLLIAAKMRDEGEISYYERDVAPRCTDGIDYVGEVGPSDKARLIGGAAALLNPIRWPEPFGLVMLEALAIGTPVITTPCGAAPEIVAHCRTGFVCDDARQMVDAVGSIDRIDRRRCRARARRLFSTGEMVARHVRAYRELLVDDLVAIPLRRRA